MRRLFLLITIPCFLSTLIGCLEREPATAPVLEPAPIITPPPAPPPMPAVPMTTVAVERFDAGVDGWMGFADEGTLSEVSWDPEGKLVWSIQTGAKQAAALIYHWQDLSRADGITIHLTPLNRSTFLILGVQETDGSVYSLVLPLDKGVDANYTASFEGFGLQLDSDDENGQLDVEQLTTLSIVDISAFLASPRPNQVSIEEITLWKGARDTQYFTGTGPDLPGRLEEFKIGVDANFVPRGEQANHGFWVGKQRVDPLELFATNGANSFRLRLWVGEDGESKLNYATELAQRAQQAGLQPYLVLFLSEDWADVNKQPAPAAWSELSLNDRAEAIRQYAYETAKHFLDRGIAVDFYEIGNEIDYGICGVFADTTHPRDASSLRSDIWPDEARLIQAAIDGVREADPEAQILLHIASSWDPPLASAFFQAMSNYGVKYDYMGLSYYPSAFGMVAASRLGETMNRLSTEIGKPIVIAETAYPAEPPSAGAFADWRRPLPGYPLTVEGQAWWLSDLLKEMRGCGDVLGVYVFSPDFWFSGDLWGPFALFDSEGNARPAVASFRSGQ